MSGENVTFGLIHGAAHGAWVWDRVIPALERLGHVGIAMDLPAEDDSAGVQEYADIVLVALAHVKDPVVLVGHSLGGLVVPVVAALRPTRHMIFLAGGLPVVGKSSAQQMLEEPDMLQPFVGENGGFNKERFYNTCSPEDAEWAFAQLRRQSRRPMNDVSPLKEWPNIPMSYIVCGEDHSMSPDWGRRTARERFGLDAVELVGSDHSPMLQRPESLARLFVRLGTAT